MSRFMPCERCGASLDTTVSPEHQCAPERLADFQLFHLREEVAALEAQVAAYLSSSHGRFEVWLAARQVRSAR